MHKNKLVVAVKTNGKVLREDKDTVFLPFGSEYSLLLKNLNTVRALLTIEIDGVNVLDGEKLVVNPNGEVDLQRFMKNGNQSQGNRFKFIERTAAIENGPRGIGAIDGIVRVSFQFEKRKALPVPTKVIEHHHHYDWYGPRYFARYPLLGDSLIMGQASSSMLSDGDGDNSAVFKGLVSQSVNSTSKLDSNPAMLQSQAKLEHTASLMNISQNSASSLRSLKRAVAEPVNDVGITVPGSISNQQFHTVEEFDLEAETEVIVLNLKGATESAKVEKPVTVQTKLKCSTCGTVNKSNAKFCRECGTGLQIV